MHGIAHLAHSPDIYRDSFFSHNRISGSLSLVVKVNDGPCSYVVRGIKSLGRQYIFAFLVPFIVMSGHFVAMRCRVHQM